MENEITSLCRRISNNLCRYSTLKEVVITPHSLSVSRTQRFSKSTVWKWGGRVNFSVEKPDRHFLSQVTKVNINSVSYVHRMCVHQRPWSGCQQALAALAKVCFS